MPSGSFVTINVIPLNMRRFNFLKIPRDEVKRVFRAELEKELRIEDEMYAKTYRTWRHTPRFYKEINVSGNDITGTIFTDDDIYGFVDAGTDVRHYRMHPKFVPKTKVRNIASYRGRYPDPIEFTEASLPGIQAREFTLEIWKRRKNKFAFSLRNATKALIERHLR